jgi:putative transposase
VFEENYRVYGVHKMWKALNRQRRLDEQARRTGEVYPPVARCTVARRMRALGLRGVVAGDHKKPVTTIPGKDHRPQDALNRDFSAPAPNTRWVADITYVPTWVGFVYVAFVLDLFSRRIVGWRVSASLRTDLALDALEQGIWTRQREGRDVAGLVHHSDRGVQYLAIRYTERLEELGIVASVGSKGDSYDNAAAEALNRLFKTEVIRRLGPWRTLEHVEFEVLKWVDWYNQRRLHSWCENVPPIEYENTYYAAQIPSPTTVEEARLTLH